MFKQTFLGDYIWEITPKVHLHYVDNSYRDIFEGEPTTTISIDDVSYPLKADLRKEFEDTKGDLSEIKQVYLDNVELADMPSNEYGPLIRVFTEQIDEHIKKKK